MKATKQARSEKDNADNYEVTLEDSDLISLSPRMLEFAKKHGRFEGLRHIRKSTERSFLHGLRKSLEQ